MTEPPTGYRFYSDLAEWWPLISPPEEYREEAAFYRELLTSAPIAVRDVLELGSGGGHNAFHLKKSFTMTLVDWSDAMLEVSRRLNPDCDHRRGDMRTIRLGREFDAVFVHDAIAYMTSESDLLAVMDTAFMHCRSGGVVLLVPDDTVETFEPRTDCGGYDAADGRRARYLEWSQPVGADQTWTETEYAFLLRDAEGSLRVVHETHRTGLFSRLVWLRLLEEAGFRAAAIPEPTTDDRTPREMFLGAKPRAGPH